ncbi:uromodulin-like 1 [Conger conger]|uniref:uromodulin-like 1 n=1 Tax=Conger conger TaxID=82655 RepID=UPI002A59BC05|nr:uromodulin-like 1 [Conger conger]
MLWIFSAGLVASFLGLCLGHNTAFEGYDLSLSGYHLCTQTKTVNSSTLRSYTVSYEERRSCGGWLPWKTCPKTLYKTVYETVVVPVTTNTTKCCDGFEQVGSYCALPLNKSAVFTARPGACPEEATTLYSRCEWDTDCSDGQKCCFIGGESCCTDAKAEGGERGWWLNMTVVVKTNYTILKTLPKGILNHTRLLHAMVTGAMGSSDTSVYHVSTRPSGAFRTSSDLLIGSSQPLPLQITTSKLNLLLKHIEEVSHVEVQDVDECTRSELNNCPPNAKCFNTEGSYNCTCLPGFVDLRPNVTGQYCQDVDECTRSELNNCPPNAECVNTEGSYNCTCLPGFVDLRPNVTSQYCQDVDECTRSELNNCPPNAECFNTKGSYNCSCLQGFVDLRPNVTSQYCQGGETSTSADSEREQNSTANGANDGVTSTVWTSVSATPVTPLVSAVQTLTAKARLKMSFKQAYQNTSSQEYRNLSATIMREVVAQVPEDIQELVDSGVVRIVITGFSPGSVLVHFVLVFHQNVSQGPVTVSQAFMVSLQNSTVYAVDNSTIGDYDECDKKEDDCSSNANCTNTWASYTCVCLEGFTDADPERPGRTCTVGTDSTGAPVSSAPPISTTTYSSTTSTTSTTGNTFTTGTASRTSTASTTSTPSTTSTASTTSTTRISPTSTVSTTPGTITVGAGDMSLECRGNEFRITVAKKFLTSKFIAESSLYLGEPECGVTDNTETHVLLTASWAKCGTAVDHNNTHNSVKITLFSNGTSPPLAANARLEVPVVCSYERNVVISAGYPPSGYYLIKDLIEGSGTFQVTVQLLNGTSPLPENYTLSRNQEVVVEVAINSSMEQIKLIVEECWATPSRSPLDSTQRSYYLQNSCPGSNNYTRVLENGNSSTSRLAIRIFTFVEQNMIFLHCKVQICFETPETTCRTDCSARNKQSKDRSRNIIGSQNTLYGPIYKSNWTDEDIMHSFQEVIFIIIGVGVVALIIGILSIVCYRKRRVGHYNFNFNFNKPKQENFTYSVFST